MNAEAEPRSRPGPDPQAGPYNSGAGAYTRAGETTSDPRDASAAAPPPNPATAAARAIPGYISELISYASYWLAAKIDSIKLGVRNAVIYAALGVVGLIAAGGMIVTGVVLLLVGLAHAISAALWHTEWAGDLIVGALVLIVIFAGVYIGLNRFMGASRKKTEQKYEGKRIEQRVQHGRDVSDRA